MSKKSQPRDAAPRGKKKGKGKRGADPGGPQGNGVTPTRPTGVPFAVVVFLAGALAMPSINNHLAGGLAFDALMLRVFAALAVAWLLSHLVYGVFLAMRPDGSVAAPVGEVTASRSRTAQAVPLTGTIVSDGVDGGFGDDDPFALPPLEVAPVLGSVGSADAAPASAGD